MRADRLVATLLLLQSRGRVTAAEVAEELEVSERTARRDLDALAAAGIPLYSQQGRGGGWSLVGGARTDLSGLTASEARALFLVAGPSSSATPEVKAALRKLVRALPEPFRGHAETAATAVVIDPSTWDRSGPPPRRPEHLDAIQQAVVDGVQVRLGYAGRDKPAGERTVHPLGLVAKGSIWYLIAGTDAGLRTFRVNRVRSIEVTTDPVERPDDFDLAEEWRRIVAEVDEKRTPYRVVLLVQADSLQYLRWTFGSRLEIIEDAGPGRANRVRIRVATYSPEAAAGELAGWVSAVEVIDPPELRDRLAVIGAELTARYA